VRIHIVAENRDKDRDKRSQYYAVYSKEQTSACGSRNTGAYCSALQDRQAANRHYYFRTITIPKRWGIETPDIRIECGLSFDRNIDWSTTTEVAMFEKGLLICITGKCWKAKLPCGLNKQQSDDYLEIL